MSNGRGAATIMFMTSSAERIDGCLSNGGGADWAQLVFGEPGRISYTRRAVGLPFSRSRVDLKRDTRWRFRCLQALVVEAEFHRHVERWRSIGWGRCPRGPGTTPLAAVACGRQLRKRRTVGFRRHPLAAGAGAPSASPLRMKPPALASNCYPGGVPVVLVEGAKASSRMVLPRAVWRYRGHWRPHRRSFLTEALVTHVPRLLHRTPSRHRRRRWITGT